jgi:hypothetical protein
MMTDIVYMMNDQISEKYILSLAMNSRGYRELPSSPYPLDVFDEVNLKFQSSVIFSEPGKFLYFSRFEPDQIYGFKRLLDGSLEPLPNFPIDLPSIRDPRFDLGGILTLEKHPYLPIFYSIQAFDDAIRTWQVMPDGQIEQLANSPYLIEGDFFIGIQGFDMTQDGSIFFLNTISEDVIYRGKVDPETGVIETVEIAYEHFEGGREALLSEDDCYLFTTRFFSPNIGRYRVNNGQLERLWPDFVADHEVVWLWRKGDLIVAGANGRLASSFLIQPDGTLQRGANSPIDIFSDTVWYADFSPSGDRVYFGGNTFMQVYDIGPNGSLTLAPNSGFLLEGWGFGVSVAPEIRGDPYSLSFIQPQSSEDSFRIQGDPDTVFYLNVNGACEGPYITDASGSFTTDFFRQPDQQLEILPYCEDYDSADRVITVPTLSPLAVTLLTLILISFTIMHRRKYKAAGSIDQ